MGSSPDALVWRVGGSPNALFEFIFCAKSVRRNGLPELNQLFSWLQMSGFDAPNLEDFNQYPTTEGTLDTTTDR